MKLFHKLLMTLIVLFTIIGMANGQIVLFNETFSNVDFIRRNLIGSSNCSVGDFNITDVWDYGNAVSLDQDWTCWANQNKSNFVFTWQDNDGFSSLYNTQNGIIMGHSLALISTPYKHSAIVHKFDSTTTLNPNTTIDFYCRDIDVGSYESDDTFLYLVFGDDDEEKAIINLGNNFSTCSIPKPYNFGLDYDFDNDCCLLTNIVGSANDCQSNSLENPSFTVADAISSCGSLTASDFEDLDYIMFYQATLFDPLISSTVYIDDLTITESALPSNITNQTYIEDFEDTNFTEYTLDRFNPKTYIGSTENPIITTNEDLLRHHTINKLNRVSDTPDASAYAVRGNTTYVYGSGYLNTRGGVDLVDVDLQTYGFIINPVLNITFDMKQNLIQWTNDDVVAYLLLRHSTNVSLINLNKDTTQPEWCSLDTLLGKNLTTSWDTYSFTIQDMIDNGCTVSHIMNETLTDIEFVSQTGTVAHDDVEYTVYLDNIIVSGSGVPINLTPPVNATPPNVTDVVYFEELFGTASFSYDEGECTTQGDSTTQMLIYSSSMPFGNRSWYCYTDTTFFNHISFNNISDTSKIDTPQGLDIYSSTTVNLGSRHRKLTTIFTGGDNIDLEWNDTISFSCMIPEQSVEIDAFLYFGEDDNTSGLISLGKDSPTPSGCNLIGIPDAPCCDLDDIVGESLDCKSDTKISVELGVQEILDACPEFNDLVFKDMTDIGFWITDYDFFGSSHIYFDDYKFSAREGVVGDNTLPIVASVSADPDPANVSESVNWTVQIWDDDPSANIYMAFDCEDDGILESNWILTGVKTKDFVCSYSSEGTYTAKAWASDIAHYPINNSGTGQVEVALTSVEEEGGDCIGFVAPECSGDCVFYDDFSYTGYPVSCNGWVGLEKHPVNGKMVVQNLDLGEYSVEVEYDDVYGYDYNSILFNFDWIINTDNRIILTMGQSISGLNAVYLYWDGGSLFALDSVSPFVTNLGSYVKGTEYSLTGIINFDNNEIDYTVFGSNTTVEFFDETTESIGDIDFDWTTIINTNFTINDFLVSTGEINTNGTTPVETVDYTYDSGLFCAINWTQDPSRFSIDNCEERGYPITGNLVGLCMPRACLSDIGSSLFASAMSNILMTLVVLIAIVLFVPLLIAMRRKR